MWAHLNVLFLMRVTLWFNAVEKLGVAYELLGTIMKTRDRDPQEDGIGVTRQEFMAPRYGFFASGGPLHSIWWVGTVGGVLRTLVPLS